MKKGKESFSSSLIGRSWHGEAGGGLARSRCLMPLLGGGTYWAFSDLTSVGRQDRNREAGRHWPPPQCSGLILQRFMGRSSVVTYSLAITIRTLTFTFIDSCQILAIACLWSQLTEEHSSRVNVGWYVCFCQWVTTEVIMCWNCICSSMIWVTTELEKIGFRQIYMLLHYNSYGHATRLSRIFSVNKICISFLSLDNQQSRSEARSSCQFSCCNAPPTAACFKVPVWHYWARSLEEMCGRTPPSRRISQRHTVDVNNLQHIGNSKNLRVIRN